VGKRGKNSVTWTNHSGYDYGGHHITPGRGDGKGDWGRREGLQRKKKLLHGNPDLNERELVRVEKQPSR